MSLADIKLAARISSLEAALELCEKRFRDYATHHENTNQFDKAQRNRAMEKMCRTVLDEK